MKALAGLLAELGDGADAIARLRERGVLGP